jgi:hypothetical protein
MKRFKEENKDFQEIVRELSFLRTHNIENKENPNTYLLFAEGALTLVGLERFLRIFREISPTRKDTLKNLLTRFLEHVDTEILLKMANFINRKCNVKLSKLSFFVDNNAALKDIIIEFVGDFRNGFLHGNFEQLIEAKIKHLGLVDCTFDQYFKRGYHIQDVESCFYIFNCIIECIDVSTGIIRRRKNALV